MRVGVPKEIKNHEYRVGLTPPSVAELVAAGHEVIVETKAGSGIDFEDQDYVDAGARIVATAAEVFDQAEMIVKVKEPQPQEVAMLRPHHLLFTYLHLAADKPQAEGLMASGATCIAYETVTSPRGGLPLLKPMSEVAGRMAVQVGAHYLEKEQGGRGVLLGGVPGVAPAKVAILGGGVSGVNAAQMAVGLRADVTIYDINNDRLAELDMFFSSQIKTAYASKAAIAAAVKNAHLVIGAVLVPGAAAPKLVTRDMLKTMKRGSVLVDIAIDQGGCFETSHATTHEDPVFEIDGVIHYCVANMPGAVARTSAFALNNATLPFALRLANMGAEAAMKADAHLANGLNVSGGKIRHAAVAEALDLPFEAWAG
ncbi:alanine dehydrogenase [Sphingomonas sp. S17]|uniref:Alanine dehydrogenase n=3 Tax=Sphingomonas TaxID=13687 RepID=A0A411LI17_SPHPI|nr:MULTISPECIES: alanine dehydrogenase [Sphingomonas]EGI54941.1 alanine dehydrogenase [Sphingomonas sp. S17]MBQ1479508.1 alanine dehydrogenase [Sphingomonas sp.]MCM3678078.1 alanine dehydrogenase [Sphingomonas paucimobilis]MDG5972711.1 alanine dehydrogenase [Sphingomonas paucimobilis]NNG59245.1 alanine dehydrogenase [Sphingomonas paucimobilis]